MPARKMIERRTMSIQFIGMLISGILFERVVCFARLFIMIIKMPVSPPEMTPPMLRIDEKLRNWNSVIRTYRISGIREVKKRLALFDVLMSYLNVSRRENDRTKYEVSIVKIPSTVMNGPKDRVATSVMFSPRMPMNVAENKMYREIGMRVPRTIAFFRSFSLPLISSRSSGIDVKPRSANITIPIGRARFDWFQTMRFSVWICVESLMKIPMTIVMIAMTPHVSIFLRPLRPSFSRRVMIIQKAIPSTRGLMLPGRIFDRDSPSPIRYARRAE